MKTVSTYVGQSSQRSRRYEECYTVCQIIFSASRPTDWTKFWISSADYRLSEYSCPTRAAVPVNRLNTRSCSME